MKAGRKNLQRACEDGTAVTLVEGESIMQVVTLRGSNLIEVRALLQHPIPRPFSKSLRVAADFSLCRRALLLLGHGFYSDVCVLSMVQILSLLNLHRPCN